MSYLKNDNLIEQVNQLLKIKNKKDLYCKANELQDYVIDNCNIFSCFTIASELDYVNVDITKVQNFLIESASPRILYRIATEIKSANIKQLQAAMIERKDYAYIAKFGAFVVGADREEIEKVIIDANDAKAAYLWLRFVKTCNPNKMKHIILKSKKPRYLFALAKLIKNKKELELIQELILKSSSCTYARLFAQYIEYADISKLEDKIVSTKNLKEMRRFAAVINSPRINKIIALF